MELDPRYIDVVVKRWINHMLKNGNEKEVQIKLNGVKFDYNKFIE